MMEKKILLEYLDDEGKRHIAVIDDILYLRFMEERFHILSKKIIDND